MLLLSINELSHELSVPTEVIEDLVERRIITPHGGRARLGELRFSRNSIPVIRRKIAEFVPANR